MSTFWFWAATVVVVLIIDAWAIARVWRTKKTQGMKRRWTALILILPAVGFGIWSLAGPRSPVAPARPKKPLR